MNYCKEVIIWIRKYKGTGDLKLKERTYICNECGNKIDRDLNASINLANYKLV